MTKARLLGLFVVMALFGILSACTGNGGFLTSVPSPLGTPSASSGSGTVTLTWAPYSGNDFKGYNVYRGTTQAVPGSHVAAASRVSARPAVAGETFTKIASLLPSATFTDTGLANGTTYDYYVTVVIKSVGRNGAGGDIEGPPSATISVTPHGDVTPPSIPTGFVAYGANGMVVLQWNANPPADGVAFYNIYRNNAPGVSTQLACPQPPATLPAPPPNSCIARVMAPGQSFNDTNVTNGNTYWYVITAVDASGNESLPSLIAMATPVSDITPPTTILDTWPCSPAANCLTNSTTASFTFHATDPDNIAGFTFQCKLDGGNLAACNSGVTYSGLADGSHTFTVHAIDLSGNIDQNGASFSWTVDTAPPDTFFLAGGTPPNPSYVNTAQFKFGSTKNPATFQCSLDAAGFSTCTSPQNYSGLSSTSHTFAVRATDAAGNTDPTPAQFTWTVDATPPIVTLTSVAGPPPTPCALASPCETNNTGASFGFISNKPGSTFTCQLDAAPYAACTAPYTVGPLADGSHTVNVLATDVGGHVSTSPATFAWNVDTVLPTVTITTGPCQPASGCYTSSANVTFTYTASENLSFFTCTLAGPSQAGSGQCGTGTAGSKTYTGLSDGAYTFTVKGTDPAGNDPAATWAFTVDTVPPVTTINTVNPAASPTNSTTISFTFSADEAGSTFQCQLDGAGFTPCTSPVSYNALADGSHAFSVEATDLAGLAGGAATHPWVVDTTAPTVAINSTVPPTTPTNLNTLTVNFTCTDDTACTTECSLDGAAFASCTSPVNLTALTEGPHNFQIEAQDAAGNPSGAPNAAYNWLTDYTNPTANFTTTPPALSNNNTPTFDFTAADPGANASGVAQIQCSMDGAPYATCTSPYTSPALPDGPHTFAIQALDNAGNKSTPPTAYTFTVDTTPPTVTVVQPNGGENLTAGTVYQIKWTESDASAISNREIRFSNDGGATFPTQVANAVPCSTNPCTYAWTVNNINTTQARIEVIDTDAATNVGSDESNANFTIVTPDTTPPTVTVVFPNGPGDLLLVPGTNTLTWTASDTGGSGLNYFNILLSSDGGATFPTVIVNNLPVATACPTLPNCSYNYSITNPDLFSRLVRIRVIAFDGALNQGQDDSNGNAGYAFYERFESEAAPATPAIQHTGPVITWWVFTEGGSVSTCGATGTGNFSWYLATDPATNHSASAIGWSTCNDGSGYWNNNKKWFVAGPFDLTDATSAMLTFKSQWNYQAGDAGDLLVSNALATTTSACNTATGWSLLGTVPFVSGTSPNFGVSYEALSQSLTGLVGGDTLHRIPVL